MPRHIANFVGFSTYLDKGNDDGNKGSWNNIDQYTFKSEDNWCKVVTNMAATGGTVATPGDGYRYHAFTSVGSASFVVTDDGVGGAGQDASVLIVGGGGSGSGGWGGSGGGAGGVLYNAAYPVTVGTYPVTVGTGRNNSSQNNPGSAGGPSSFNSISVGGGGGGSHTGNGGGIGGAQGSCSDTSGFTAYGPNPGGGAPTGGGGGAGGPGVPGPSRSGGIGVRFPAFTDYGTPGPGGTGGYFAGGGSSGSSNAGAAGGGSNSPTPAIANTGGGGGSQSDGYPNTSAAGIVLIRYPYS